MKKKESSYKWLLWVVIWLVALKVIPDSLLGIVLFVPLVIFIYHFRNKIIDYENKSNIWKQGFIISIFIFIAVIIYSINEFMSSGSEMRGLVIFIPFLFFELLSYKYIGLRLPFIISISLSLVTYYILGLLIAFVINNVKKITSLKTFLQ